MKVGKSSGGFIRLNKLLDHNVTFVVLRVSDIFCCISEMHVVRIPSVISK